MVSSQAPGSSPAVDLPSTTGGVIPETLGRYRLLSKIAKGGMAEVFAARSYGVHGFEKTVALKRILPKFGQDPQFVRMMVDEAKISVLLNHPNIAQILELGEQDGDYFIVMEFVPGQSLSALIKRLKETNENVPILEACFIVVELLQGLHAAHTQSDMTGKPASIIHRDVSPQNTLLSFDGHVKVIDFGIARARDRLEATEIGTIKGKLRYLAPEMIDPGRFAAQGDFDHRVDVFAAGIVLWELVSGRVLFPGDDELKVYDDITDGKTPNLAAEGLCDPQLMKIIDRALFRQLDKRYPSAEEFADALRAYVYRADPGFTHKRVAAILDRAFPDEKAELTSLERGQTAEVPSLRLREKKAGGPDPKAPASSSSSSSSSSKGGAAAAAPGETRHMRSDKHPAPPGSRPAPGQPGFDGISEQATQVADVADVDPRGELRKEVTVVTLVSRQHVMATAAGSKAASDASGVFSLPDDATLTVSADTLREAKNKLDARRAPGAPPLAPAMRPVGDTKTERVDRSPDRPERGDRRERSDQQPPAPRGDETPLTRQRVSADTAPRADDNARMRRRLIVASAAVGVLLALGIVAVVELFDQPRAASAHNNDGAATEPPTDPAVGVASTVQATLRSAVDGAVVVVGDQRGPSPLIVQVKPGDVLAVRVEAPGLRADVENVSVPADQQGELVVDLAPRWLPARVEARVEPATAEVLIDGEVLGKETAVEVDAVVVVDVSAPGFLSARQEMKVMPGQPLVIAVKLVPEDKVATAPVTGTSKKLPAARGTGTLKLKTTPYWGQVTIDGKVYDDATPLSVQLSAGTHDVVVAHPPKNLVRRFKVVVKANDTVTRTITFD